MWGGWLYFGSFLFAFKAKMKNMGWQMVDLILVYAQCNPVSVFCILYLLFCCLVFRGQNVLWCVHVLSMVPYEKGLFVRVCKR